MVRNWIITMIILVWFKLRMEIMSDRPRNPNNRERSARHYWSKYPEDISSARENKSTLGGVTPLGRPRSACTSDVERRFLESWDEIAKWPWRSRSITPVFNTSQEKLKMHIWRKFGDSCSNMLLHGEAKYSRILSQNGKMTLKVKVNDP